MNSHRKPKNTLPSFAGPSLEETYRLLVENTGMPILFLDRDARLLFINQIGAQNFGGGPEALVGKSLQELLPQQHTQDFLARIQKAFDSGVGDQFEDNALFPSAPRWSWMNLQPIKDEFGRAIGVQIISQDITKRKEVEQELVKATQIAEQSTRAIERFLAHFSHEIRTPMNTVTGMAHLLQKTATNPQQRQYLQTLQTASNHLLGIINNVLDFSKIEAGVIEFEQIEFNLADILENVKQTFLLPAQEKNIQLMISCHHRIPPVLIGDPMRLNQILLNLVGNAIKFTEKGVVIVDVELLEEDDQTAGLSFSVADTGIGIPPDKLEVIFENFAQANHETRRKYGGTGLGLTIVKQLVEMQGGSISVQSQVDKGATFYFTLRFEKVATSAVKSAQIKAAKEPAIRLDGLRALLVEDDKLSQRVTVGILSQRGATVDVADNGRVAIQKLATNSYDIVLMDVLMPEMDGYETATYVRNEMSRAINRIPILAITASASVKDCELALACGMNDYIAKPFDPDKLCTKIMMLIDKQRCPYAAR